MNKENLLKLATYLLSGELKADFNMRDYNGYGICGEYLTDCGTVGCAIGHGPYAGIPKTTFESWDNYASRVFTADFRALLWCFSSFWDAVDNTAEGAAKRILYLLRTGSAPDDYMEQCDGTASLSYLNEKL